MDCTSKACGLLSLIYIFQVVCHVQAALPAVCDYMHPYITEDSGPVNITVLTLKEPNQITIEQKNETYIIEDGLCIDTLDFERTFPCPSMCEQYFCYLTMLIPNISGVDAIYLYSKSFEHIGGVYRKTGMLARETYFEINVPPVHCMNVQDVVIPWTVRKPEGVNVMSCTFQGNIDEFYANLEDTSDPQTVTLTAFFTDSAFEGYSCWVNVNKVSVIVEHFFYWLDAAYFEVSDIPANRLIGHDGETSDLSWKFVATLPDQTRNFVCLNHEGIRCTGITTIQAPNKCEIENTDQGMKYVIRANISVGEFAAFVCYIGEKSFAQSVYKLGSNDANGLPTKDLEAKIALNLNGNSVPLTHLRSHYLWLQNVKIEDVTCKITENNFICRLSPDNLKIYWMISKGDRHSIIDILSVNETYQFTGSFGSCHADDLFIQIDGGKRDFAYFHVLHFEKDHLDTTSMLSDFLQKAFSSECKNLRQFHF